MAVVWPCEAAADAAIRPILQLDKRYWPGAKPRVIGYIPGNQNVDIADGLSTLERRLMQKLATERS